MSANVIGVVLAGGKSSRMGRDKGTIEADGLTWTESAVRRFSDAGLSAVVSINERQLHRYAQIFPRDLLILDSVPDAHGPLRGILSCHKARPKSDLFVTACDLPLLPADLIRRLLEESLSAEAPYAAFRTDFIEPLCALYSSGALARLLAKLEAGDLDAHCPRKILTADPRTLVIDAGAGGMRAFTNMNRPEDLAATHART